MFISLVGIVNCALTNLVNINPGFTSASPDKLSRGQSPSAFPFTLQLNPLLEKGFGFSVFESRMLLKVPQRRMCCAKR